MRYRISLHSFSLSIACFLALFLLVAVPAVSALTPQERYVEADIAYKKLRNSPSKQKYREFWLKCIAKYQEVYLEAPTSPWAPAGMYQAANLYHELYKRSYRNADLNESIDLYQRIIKRFPESAYNGRSAKRLATLANQYPTAGKPTPKTPPRSDPDPQKEKPQPTVIADPEPEPETEPSVTLQNGDSFITGLRYWSNPEYTRVVIDADEEHAYFHRLLKKDPDLKKPQRLYVDLESARLGQNVPKLTPINDNLLIQARAGQYTPHTVRVVIDIKSFDNYKIFSLRDPFRLVIDVWGEGSGDAQTADASDDPTVIVSTDNLTSSAIAKQLALGVRKIVIDPGHGGKDPGAPGYLKGVWEKDVVLAIAKRLAQKMRTRLKCDVLLTRSTDTYLTLEERTAIANTRNADLFISLHCNAAKNRRLAGLETYFLNLATDNQAITVAARENATSEKNISDLESILNDLMKNAKINESSRLATQVQSSLHQGLKKNYPDVVDLGVKQAPFYVLLGARMPSILIETSFLSNKTECKRLTSDVYQERLCDAIIDGVEIYINQTNPRTLSRR